MAQVKLASVFTDDMVLQQQTKAALWGWSAGGKKVTVIPSWSKKAIKTTADADGKWKVYVETPVAGGPYTITVSDGQALTLKNILIGEVWLCAGQSNMEMAMRGFTGQPVTNSNQAILKSTNPKIRVYTVLRDGAATPKDNSKPASWKEATPESISQFSATAYFFGKELYEVLHVPIGLINVSYGGSTIESWMSATGLKGFPEVKIPEGDKLSGTARLTPTALYNAMLHPIIGYGIKGMLWYQGENNVERPDEYEILLPQAVNQWRQEWNQGVFPFYFAQIAPYDYTKGIPRPAEKRYNSAYLRDAQRKAVAKIPNAGMAVLLDVGEEKNIHPAHKQEVGQRFAYLALSKTYNLKGFGAESPAYDTLVVSNGVAEVRFKHAPIGLTSYGKDLTQFEIAGKDKVFYPAKATINRNAVKVSAPEVKEPVAVRYGFRNYLVGELFSTEGLPASSFRTDDW